MDIPIVLQNLGDRENSTLCAQNAVMSEIPQRMPIPRPLTKVNGQIISRFSGTNSNEQYQFGDAVADTGDSSSVPPLLNAPTSSQDGTGVATSQTHSPVSVVSVVTTIIQTATVSAQPVSSEETELSESNFGGPGGDLTDVDNNNVGFEQSNAVKSTGTIVASLRLCMMVTAIVLVI